MSFPCSFPEGCEKRRGGKELPCRLWPDTGRAPALKWFCDSGGSSEVSGVSFVGTASEKKGRFAGRESLSANHGSTQFSHDRCLSRFPLQTFIFRGLWVCSKNPLRVYTWFTPGLCLPKFILTTFLCGSSSGSLSWIKPDDAHWFPMLPCSSTTGMVFVAEEIKWAIITSTDFQHNPWVFCFFHEVLACCCWTAGVSWNAEVRLYNKYVYKILHQRPAMPGLAHLLRWSVHPAVATTDKRSNGTWELSSL